MSDARERERDESIQREAGAWLEELEREAVESAPDSHHGRLRFMIECLVFEIVELRQRLERLERAGANEERFRSGKATGLRCPECESTRTWRMLACEPMTWWCEICRHEWVRESA